MRRKTFAGAGLFLLPAFSVMAAVPRFDSPFAFSYRSLLSAAARRPPNFSGHYRLETWTARNGCFRGAAIDLETGAVSFMPVNLCPGRDHAKNMARTAAFGLEGTRVALTDTSDGPTHAITRHFDFDGTDFSEVPTTSAPPAPGPKAASTAEVPSEAETAPKAETVPNAETAKAEDALKPEAAPKAEVAPKAEAGLKPEAALKGGAESELLLQTAPKAGSSPEPMSPPNSANPPKAEAAPQTEAPAPSAKSETSSRPEAQVATSKPAEPVAPRPPTKAAPSVTAETAPEATGSIPPAAPKTSREAPPAALDTSAKPDVTAKPGTPAKGEQVANLPPPAADDEAKTAAPAVPAGSRQALSFSACGSTWGYFIDSTNKPNVSLLFQGLDKGPTLVLRVKDGATTNELSGAKDSGPWNLDLTVPPFGREEMSRIVYSGRLLYVSLAFIQSADNKLTLTSFGFNDTGKPCPAPTPPPTAGNP